MPRVAKKTAGTTPRQRKRTGTRNSADRYTTAPLDGLGLQDVFTAVGTRKSQHLAKLGDDTALNVVQQEVEEEEDLDRIRTKLLFEAGQDVDFAERKTDLVPGKSWGKIHIACFEGKHKKVGAILRKFAC